LAVCTLLIIQSYGFSDKVGLVAHGDDESVYLSGKKKDEIEGEIRRYALITYHAET
jgi:ATP-dependent metalloprotease